MDVSIWLHKAIREADVKRQFFLEPKVPVTEVNGCISARVELLRKAGFEPLFVFDGKYHPLKDATHVKRYHDRDFNLEKLRDGYLDPTSTFNRIMELQKGAVYIRDDLMYEVIKYCEKEDIRYIGAPFEADSQIISLFAQGIVDYALTEDSDIPLQGATKTIMRLSASGKCCLVQRILECSDLKTAFKSDRDLTQEDLTYFSCFQGNDYVPNTRGEGIHANIKRMITWVKCDTPDDRAEITREYLSKQGAPLSCKFNHAVELWEHSPAFYVQPTTEGETPRSAFLSGDFTVELRSMDGDAESLQDGYWINPEGSTDNLRIGFIPSAELPNAQDGDRYNKFFRMQEWSRTGKAVEGIPDLCNDKGEILCHGSIIDFEKRPARLLHENQLLFWLAARGIANDFNKIDDPAERRDKIVNTVVDLATRDPPLPPLPRLLLRGNGGYIRFQILESASEAP